MSKLLAPPTGTRLVTYADDSTALRSGPSTDPICLEINNYLYTLNDWFASRNLLISAPKSSATLFTTWGNEKSKILPIKIKGFPVPIVENPTILGVSCQLFTFGAHAKKIKEKIGTRNPGRFVLGQRKGNPPDNSQNPQQLPAKLLRPHMSTKSLRH